MKKLVLVIFIISSLIALILYAQQKKVNTSKQRKEQVTKIQQKTGKAQLDSLLMELDNYIKKAPRYAIKGADEIPEIQDTNYIDLLCKISNEYANMNPKLGFEFSDKAMDIATKLDHKNSIIKSFLSKGHVFFGMSKLDSAIVFYNKCLDYFASKNDKENVAFIKEYIGIVNTASNDSVRAMENFESALNFYDKTNKLDAKARILNLIGGLKTRIANVKDAKKYIEDAIAIYMANDNQKGLSKSYIHLAALSRKVGNLEEAIEYYSKSNLILTTLKDSLALASNLENIGLVYDLSSNYNKALENYNQSIEILKELGQKKRMSMVLRSIGFIYINQSNFVEAEEYFRKSLAIQEELEDMNGIAADLHNLGRALHFQGRNPEALELIIRAKKINEIHGFRKWLANNLVMIGIIFEQTGNFSKGTESYFDALEIYEELGDDNGKIMCLDYLGGMFSSVNDFSKALEYSNKAMALAEKLKNKSRLSEIVGNIALIYKRMNNKSLALEYFNKALKFSEEINSLYHKAANLHNIGTIYSSDGQYLLALDYYQKALVINEKNKNINYQLKNLTSIASTYTQISLDSTLRNKPSVKDSLIDLSIDMLLKTYALSKENNFQVTLMDICNNLSYSYNILGNYEKALEYFKEATVLKDSIYSSENLKKIADLESKRELELKQKENELLAERTKLQESELSRRNQELANLSNLQKIQKLELDKRKLDITTKNNELALLEKDKELKELELREKNIEGKKKEKEIQLLNKDKEYQGVVRSSLYGGMTLLGSLAILLFLFFKRKSKDNKIIQKEREKAEQLLLNVLPETIATRLKEGETPIADRFDEASVVFIDIVDFTTKSIGASPEKIVEVLNKIYTEFDQIAKKHGLEKIKTIGDCYMAASGIPEPRKDYAEASANFAIEAMEKMNGFDIGDGTIINFRCGIDSGPVIAGVIGEQKFIYDLWGDMVNTASRMETSGVVGKIQCTERFRNVILNGVKNPESALELDSSVASLPQNDKTIFQFEERGEIEIKGKGLMRTWFLIKN